MTWNEILKAQPTAAKILMNGVRRDQLAHAYLLAGQRGVGKRNMAIQLARTFFCQERDGLEPCGHCADCKRIDSGNHPDLTLIQPEGRSVKKHQVTELIKAFSYKGMESGKKFFIVEQADLMTAQAANSLLKFIEEPEGITVSVLITENIQAMLETIISRCQVLSFKPLSPEKIQKHLIDQGISPVLAKTATAVTTDLEEAMALCSDEWFATARSIVLHFMEELFTKPNRAIITMYEECATHFNDSDRLKVTIDLMLIWLRDILSLQSGRRETIVFSDHSDRLVDIADSITLERTSHGLSLLLEASRRLSSNGNPLSILEQLSLRLQEGAMVNV